MDNQVSFKVWARYALFTDPVTKTGGDKCSYQVPTYEAIKGIMRSIYWKPTFVWVIDKVRIIKPIRTESKNIKPLKMNGGNSLAIYTYLAEVEYQVEAHFEWSTYYADETFLADRIPAKHNTAHLMRITGLIGARCVEKSFLMCQLFIFRLTARCRERPRLDTTFRWAISSIISRRSFFISIGRRGKMRRRNLATNHSDRFNKR